MLVLKNEGACFIKSIYLRNLAGPTLQGTKLLICHLSTMAKFAGAAKQLPDNNITIAVIKYLTKTSRNFSQRMFD